VVIRFLTFLIALCSVGWFPRRVAPSLLLGCNGSWFPGIDTKDGERTLLPEDTRRLKPFALMSIQYSPHPMLIRANFLHSWHCVEGKKRQIV
jgi:hypothetical protein